MTDFYQNRFLSDHYNQQYDEMKKNCPWFNPKKHFLVVISDSSGNFHEFIGVGSTFNNSKPALRVAYKRLKKYSSEYSVDLLVNNRCQSYVF